MEQEIKISNSFPPNFDQLKARFGDDNKEVIFCYGDTIYNPYNRIIREDLIVHEQVHVQQQTRNEMTPELFFNRYLTDNDFMLEAEAEAYAAQLNFLLIKEPGARNRLLHSFAAFLTDPVYGELIDIEEAEDLISKYLFANHDK